MFWFFLGKPKIPTIEDRIIDIIGMKSSTVDIQYESSYTPYSYKYFDNRVVITVSYMRRDFVLVKADKTNYEWYIKDTELAIIDVKEDLEVKISARRWEDILRASEEAIKNKILMRLYPIKSKELEKVFNDVTEIEEGKEQIEYITERIRKIRDNY